MLAGQGEGPRRGVLDAGALGAITSAHRFGPDVVLTPHRGEAERLARRLEVDPDLPAPALARALAGATGATVLLKGAITLVAPGDGGPLRSQDDATSQLAAAGTGDVLAGVLGTLLAAGLPGPTPPRSPPCSTAGPAAWPRVTDSTPWSPSRSRTLCRGPSGLSWRTPRT